MTDATARRSPSSCPGVVVRLVLLGLLATMTLSGCDGAGEPSGRPGAPAVRRLELRAVGAGSTSGPAVDLVAGDLLAWRVEAPGIETSHVPGRPDEPLLVLTAGRAERPLRLERALPAGAAGDQLRVAATFAGEGVLIAEALRDGAVVARSPPVDLPPAERLVEVLLDLPLDGRDGPAPDAVAPDAVALVCEGTFRRLGLAGVTLGRQDDAVWLPDPDGPPELVPLDGDARRGVGLVSGVPVVASFVVPDRGRLGFSLGRPAPPSAGPAPAVTVALSRGGEEVARDVVPMEGGGWTRHRLDLSAHAGSRLEVRFALPERPRAACVVAEAQVWTPADGVPTVVLVTSDTHRGDHLGAAGRGVDVDTPVLDALAARGVRFADAFSSTNVTNPSHVALMTGVHPRDTGVHHNQVPLADPAPVLAERFAAEGWATAAVVSSVHLAHGWSGLGQGFDRLDAPLQRPRDAEDSVAVALEALDAAAGRPLFLWLHLFDAHVPYEVPDELLARYWDLARDPEDPSLPDPGLPPGPIVGESPDLRDLEYPRAKYRAEVTYLDRELGRLLHRPRVAAGVVALVGDHGEALGRHRVFFDHADLHPETVHVPLLLAWPGGPQGVVVDAPVTHLDLGRTLLELAGVPADGFPGRSLVPLVEGTPRAGRPRFQLAFLGDSASVSHGDDYLVLHLTDHQSQHSHVGYERHQVELYDLREDPGCTADLSKVEPERTARLAKRLVDWLEGARSLGWTDVAIEDPAAIRQLQELGYVAVDTADTAPLWEEDDCAHCRSWRRPSR